MHGTLHHLYSFLNIDQYLLCFVTFYSYIHIPFSASFTLFKKTLLLFYLLSFRSTFLQQYFDIIYLAFYLIFEENIWNFNEFTALMLYQISFKIFFLFHYSCCCYYYYYYDINTFTYCFGTRTAFLLYYICCIHNIWADEGRHTPHKIIIYMKKIQECTKCKYNV